MCLMKFEKGQMLNPIPAATAATTTSANQCAKGHNAMIVHANISGSGAWTVKVQGAEKANGTYKDVYDAAGNLMSTGSISASRCKVFVGVPEYFKIVATEDSGTATIDVHCETLTM